MMRFWNNCHVQGIARHWRNPVRNAMAIRKIEDTKEVIRSRESNGTVNAMAIKVITKLPNSEQRESPLPNRPSAQFEFYLITPTHKDR
jgi:hypothetical protein